MAGTPEVLVFGAGPAGLRTALTLKELGVDVWVVAPDSPPPYRSVYSTCQKGNHFLPEVGRRELPAIRCLTADGAEIIVSIPPSGRRYFMVDYPKALSWLEEKAGQMGVRIEKLPPSALQTINVEKKNDSVWVGIEGEIIKGGRIVDATGVEAKISRLIDPRRRNEDFLAEYVFGGFFPQGSMPEELWLVFGPAAGTCWVAPGVNGGIDVVYSAWGPYSGFSRFMKEAPSRFEILIDFLRRRGDIVVSNSPELYFRGMIRSQPTPPPLYPKLYGVGEAAGMAKPLSGDSFRIALEEGRNLAEAIFQLPQGFLHAVSSQRFGRSSLDFFSDGYPFTRLCYRKNHCRGSVI